MFFCILKVMRTVYVTNNFSAPWRTSGQDKLQSKHDVLLVRLTAHPPSPSLPAYLPLSDQLSLQVVDLQEGAAGVDGADRPHDAHGPPRRPGETFDLLGRPVPEPTPSVHIAAAHGQRLVQAAVQRGRLQVCVRFGSECHLRAGILWRSAKNSLRCSWDDSYGECGHTTSSPFQVDFPWGILSPAKHHSLFIL